MARHRACKGRQSRTSHPSLMDMKPPLLMPTEYTRVRSTGVIEFTFSIKALASPEGGKWP